MAFVCEELISAGRLFFPSIFSFGTDRTQGRSSISFLATGVCAIEAGCGAVWHDGQDDWDEEARVWRVWRVW